MMALRRETTTCRRHAWQWFTLFCVALLAATLLVRQAPFALAQEGDDEADAASEPDEEASGAEKPAKAAADTAAPAPENEQESYLEWLWKASGYVGLLIGMESIALLALIITNIIQLRLPVFVPPEFVEAFEQKLQAKDYQGAYELAKKDESFLAKLLSGGLGRLSRGFDEAMTGMKEVAEDENMSIDHRLSYIAIIGSTATMLGLLGTVQGMVAAFSKIAQSTVSPKPSELAEGITLALVTTLEGLIVAIPATAAFALFKNRQARIVLESSIAADNLMGRFSSVGKRAGGAAPSAAAPAAAER